MQAPAISADAILARTRFLIVDDKPYAREILYAALAGRSAGVREAICVDQAIAVLSKPGTDITGIVADWAMLPVGGLELLRMIRCRALADVDPRTGFVIVTSRLDADAAKCAAELDAQAFAVAPGSSEKPKLDKLAATVGLALARRWPLQDAAHYASAPCVVPPPTWMDRTRTPVRARESRAAPFLHVSAGRTLPTRARAANAAPSGRPALPAAVHLAADAPEL